MSVLELALTLGSVSDACQHHDRRLGDLQEYALQRLQAMAVQQGEVQQDDIETGRFQEMKCSTEIFSMDQ